MLTVSHPPSSALPHPINPILPRKLFLEQNLTRLISHLESKVSHLSITEFKLLTSAYKFPACVLQPFKHCFCHTRSRAFWRPALRFPNSSFAPVALSAGKVLSPSPHQPLRETYPRYISILQRVFFALLLTIQSAARLRGWTALSISLPTVPGNVLAVD